VRRDQVQQLRFAIRVERYHGLCVRHFPAPACPQGGPSSA
jgi:hypothetical protein